MPHNAKINWYQRAVRRDKDVARMHIGMKEAVPEYLIEKTARSIFGKLFNIMTGGCQCFDIIYPDSINPFDDQHSSGGMIKVNIGDMNTVIIAQIIGQPPGGGGF